MWNLAIKSIPKLHRAKISDMVVKPIPVLRSQRRKINMENVPKISLESAFMNKETKDVSVVQGEKIPRNRFPQEYQKLYETATVQVINLQNNSIPKI